MEKLLNCLNDSQKITYQEKNGEFKYYQSNPEQGMYKSIYISGSLKMFYTVYGNTELKDTLEFKENVIAVNHKYDPLSIKIASISFYKDYYLLLVGKSLSASGSGTQLSYYTLLKMKDNKVIETFFFESRFGSFLNIGDFNNDGKLDFIKIINGEKQDEFIAKLYDIERDTPIGNYNLVLFYKGNDIFCLKKSNWFKKIDINCLYKDS